MDVHVQLLTNIEAYIQDTPKNRFVGKYLITRGPS